MQILGWILLGIIWMSFSALICSTMDNSVNKKYMLVINNQVKYFQSYQQAIDYIRVREVDEELEYKLFVRDKGEYIFLFDTIGE